MRWGMCFLDLLLNIMESFELDVQPVKEISVLSASKVLIMLDLHARISKSIRSLSNADFVTRLSKK